MFQVIEIPLLLQTLCKPCSTSGQSGRPTPEQFGHTIKWFLKVYLYYMLFKGISMVEKFDQKASMKIIKPNNT